MLTFSEKFENLNKEFYKQMENESSPEKGRGELWAGFDSGITALMTDSVSQQGRASWKTMR